MRGGVGVGRYQLMVLVSIRAQQLSQRSEVAVCKSGVRIPDSIFEVIYASTRAL